MSEVVKLVTPSAETNEEAIKLLEDVLKDARAGLVVEVAISMVEFGGKISTAQTTTNNSSRLLGAIHRSAWRLQKAMDETSTWEPYGGA